ncbi:MAG: type III effector HrpK, partial [Pseudomonas sp.]|uniref:type III effector HrpK domain-containing protein n=1 Tax=Pseudomonas sp. TaxID=306 RepID=UPI00120719A1
MRISSTPYNGVAPQPAGADAAQGSPLAEPKSALLLKGGVDPNVRFGASTQPSPANGAFAGGSPSGKAQSTEQQLLSLLNQLTQLFKGQAQSSPESATSSPDAPAQNAPTGGAVATGNPQPVAQVNAAALAAPVEAAKPAEEPKSTEAAFLDDSKYSSPKELERWAPMVANLPADQRDQAAKELNRPIAAARMAAEKGPDAAKAMDFINANPSLKTAVDTGKHGGKADGKITDGDLKAFAKNMQKAADSADKDIASYQKDHPDADPQSLEMVRSAAMMRANEPLTKAADPKHALGADGKTKVDGLTSADGLKAIQNDNPGLGGPLKQAAKTWSQPGFLTQIDQGGLSGRSLAAHSP